VHGQFQFVVLEPSLAMAMNTVVNTLNTPAPGGGVN